MQVRLANLRKSFAYLVRALDGLSLTVASGECVAIVGPSGCGKTTLLRVIAGLEMPEAGDIHLDERRVNEVPCHQRGVALLFQRSALLPTQTVHQNLRWPWTLRNPWAFLFRADRPRVQELEQLANVLGLGADLERPVQELSGGQQQRVALGRCLLQQANVWLLDEPLAHLDAPLRTELRQLIRTLARQRGSTLLFVTHDPGEAFAIGDRVAVMHEGRLLQVDPPARLCHAPSHRFVAELAHHDRGGLNGLAGQLRLNANQWTFVSPWGSWSFPKPERLGPADFSSDPKKMLSKDEIPHIIIGIAADKVECLRSHPDSAREIQVTLPVLHQEPSTHGTWVVAGDERGRLVGRANEGQHGNVGRITMRFSMHDSYGFDGVTGQTLWTPSLPTELGSLGAG